MELYPGEKTNRKNREILASKKPAIFVDTREKTRDPRQLDYLIIILFIPFVLQGSVARKMDNFIHWIVTFSNFLNMFSNCYNPDKKSLLLS